MSNSYVNSSTNSIAINARMVERVNQLKQSSIAKSTLDSYQSMVKSYIHFCQYINSEPFPPSESNLCSFVSFITDSERLDSLPPVKYKTASSYVTGIISWSEIYNCSNPLLSSHPELDRVLAGIQRTSINTTKKIRKPITPDLIQNELKSTFNFTRNFDRMIYSAMTLATYG